MIRSQVLLSICLGLAAAACAPEKPDTSVPFFSDTITQVNNDATVPVGDSAGANDIVAVYWYDNSGPNNLCTLDTTSIDGDDEAWDCTVPDGPNDNVNFIVENAGGFTANSADEL